jgi:hypothetical protein
MKITIEHYGEKASWESNRHGQIDNLMAIDDTSIKEAFYSFIGLLIVCGWQPDTINEHILLMAEEIKE